MSFQCLWTNKDELIHRATRQGRIFSLETYLQNDPTKNLNEKYEFGRSKWTLLIAACFFQHENIVRMLLRRFQLDIDAVGDVKLDFVHEVMYDVTPLWVAVAVGHFGIVKLLVEQGKANVNHLSVTRSSPLRAASYIGNLQIARYLIEHGADMKLVRDGNYTNLMLSAYRQHRHLVEFYLDELKCDPNEEDQDGRTPLHYAIDGGSVEVIDVLLKRGAKNHSKNSISPVFWAALEARNDLVDGFENYSSSDQQWIEARELLAASYANIESKNYHLEKAIEHFTLAFQWRIKKNLPKSPSRNSPNEAFDFHEECRNYDEFEEILSEPPSRFHIESLLVQERILGPTNKRYRRALRFNGALLADTQQYDAAISLWLYELKIREEFSISFDRSHLREFVHMFAEMIINDVEKLPDKAILEVLKALDEEISHQHHYDFNLTSLFYLIVVISHIPDEQKNSSLMKEIFRRLISIVRRDYRTKENNQQWTLLHLSMMMGSLFLNDRHLMALCKYPCHKTVRLLLQCGGDVDAMDCQRNTPLHLIAQRREDIENILFIINLLCDNARAHPDCVNNSSQTPLESASNLHVKIHLRQKLTVGQLKCLCARKIQENQFLFQSQLLPPSLRAFLHQH